VARKMRQADCGACASFSKVALRISWLTGRCNFTNELRVKSWHNISLNHDKMTEVAVQLEHAETTAIFFKYKCLKHV
jgi:hypothetical protein